MEDLQEPTTDRSVSEPDNSKKSKNPFKPNKGLSFNNVKRNNFNLKRGRPVVRRSGRG